MELEAINDAMQQINQARQQLEEARVQRELNLQPTRPGALKKCQTSSLLSLPEAKTALTTRGIMQLKLTSRAASHQAC